MDSSGNAYVVGYTDSPAFPTTPGAYDTCYGTNFPFCSNGMTEAFVSKLNAAGNALVYSTYLGGTFDDYALALDVEGTRAYVTGQTSSTDFPRVNAYDPTHNGGVWDAFVTKVNDLGSALDFSTYLGGNGADIGRGIAAVSTGAPNVFIAGDTTSGAATFPIVAAYDASENGGRDAFVTQFTDTGSSLVYSTFLGGAGDDIAYSLDLLGSNAYVAGSTASANFPALAGSWDTTQPGAIDAFVTRFSASGSSLDYSTYVGGATGDDQALSVAVDSVGLAYVAGQTSSNDFPTFGDIAVGGFGGGADAFAFKLRPSLSNPDPVPGTPEDEGDLFHSTYLGGSSTDSGRSVAIDSDCNPRIYVAGDTSSANFPPVPISNPIDGSLGGTSDAFVTKLSFDYSTYLGGVGSDNGYSVDVDCEGYAYITGATLSADFPATAGAYDPTHNGGYCGPPGSQIPCWYDVFLTKVHPSGRWLEYSTFVGGSRNDLGSSVSVDATGSAFVVGSTGSSNFPTTPGAFDPSFNGGFSDAFAFMLQPGGEALSFSTFLGGNQDDSAAGVRVDSQGYAYVVGKTFSSDYPTVPGSMDTVYNGNGDAFVTKLLSDGSNLLYSTFHGGTGDDSASSVVVSGTPSNAYVTGQTFSSDFPVGYSGGDTSYGGAGDAFVTKMAADGSAFVYSYFLGGSAEDAGSAISLRSNANDAFVAGTTASAGLPTTPLAYQTTFQGGATDAFVAQFTASGSIFYLSYLGGSGDDFGRGIDIDWDRSAVVVGDTTGSFPIANPLKAFQPSFKGGASDGFIAKLLGDGTTLGTLVYSSYLGGSDTDSASSVALSGWGSPFVTGSTQSSDFPFKPWAFDPSFGGVRDAFSTTTCVCE